MSEVPCCGNSDREASFNLCSSSSSCIPSLLFLNGGSEEDCNADEIFDDANVQWSESDNEHVSGKEKAGRTKVG